MKVILIGTGNVATAFCDWFSTIKSIEIAGLWGRNKKLQQQLDDSFGIPSLVDFSAIPDDVDIIFLAISDSAISIMARELLPFLNENQLVVHCSGATPLNAMDESINNRGVFYPLQSFSKGRVIDYSEIPIFITATNPETLTVLRSFTALLGNTSHKIDDKQRATLHLAAVFANNFTNHLFNISFDILKQNQINPNSLIPLIKETVNKLEDYAPMAAQTGPAKRNDQTTIQHHLTLLKDEEALQEVYEVLTEQIINTYCPK